jgi:hypothetical protein
MGKIKYLNFSHSSRCFSYCLSYSSSLAWKSRREARGALSSNDDEAFQYVRSDHEIYDESFRFVNNLSLSIYCKSLIHVLLPPPHSLALLMCSCVCSSSLLVVTLNVSAHTKHIRRGSAGFDNSGRGYYFAGQVGRPPPPPQPEPYPGSDRYDQAHRPPPSHANHYNPPQSHSQHTTPRAPPEFYQGKPAQSSSQVLQVSSGTIGTVDSNTSTNNKNSNKEIDDKDKSR